MKPLIQLLPKDTDTFKLPNRVIGSGRITRRIIVTPAYKSNNGFKQMKPKTNNKRNRKQTPPPPIKQTSQTKRIWLHYKTKGFPLTKHGDAHTWAKYRAVEAIKKALKDYSPKQIVAAIDLAHTCFNSKWFKIKFAPNRPLDCQKFFNYNEWEMKNRTAPLNGTSWFKEFVQGQNYIEENYSYVVKDQNPDITAMVEKVYRKNQRYDTDDNLTPNETNALIKCAARVREFTTANGLESDWTAVDAIDRVINDYEKPFKIKYPAFLFGKELWQRLIPNELVRYGTFERRSRITIV